MSGQHLFLAERVSESRREVEEARLRESGKGIAAACVGREEPKRSGDGRGRIRGEPHDAGGGPENLAAGGEQPLPSGERDDRDGDEDRGQKSAHHGPRRRSAGEQINRQDRRHSRESGKREDGIRSRDRSVPEAQEHPHRHDAREPEEQPPGAARAGKS